MTDLDQIAQDRKNIGLLTLPVNCWLVDRITKVLAKHGFNKAVKFAQKHHVSPKMVAMINWHMVHTCLYCGHLFYTVELTGIDTTDNRQYYCTRGCRDDWNLNRLHTEYKIEQLQDTISKMVEVSRNV